MASSSRDELSTWMLHSVWRKLPMELVEDVLKCIPFDSLMRFRAVCKRFNCLITTPKFARECNRQQFGKPVPVIVRSSIPLDSCAMEVFNSETNSWLMRPLPILEASLYPLKLSAASEGLVCFVTQGYERFVVWNPLTGAFRLLKFPDPGFSDICTLFCGQAAFIALVVDTQMGTFTLVLVTTSKNEIEQKTFVYDSVNGSWRSGAPLPYRDDFIIHNFIKVFTFNGSIYVLLEMWKFCFPIYRLLKYNVCKDNWSVTPRKDLVMLYEDASIPRHHGQVLVVSLRYPLQSDFRIGYRIAHCAVIQAVRDYGEIMEDWVMFQQLYKNFVSYQGWRNTDTFNSKLTTIGNGDILCTVTDPCAKMSVLHFNSSSKKFSLLPVCPKTKLYEWLQNIFQLNLLEPSLTIDL